MAIKIILIKKKLFDLTIFSSIQRRLLKMFFGFFVYSNRVIRSTVNFNVAASPDTKCAGHRLNF